MPHRWKFADRPEHAESFKKIHPIEECLKIFHKQDLAEEEIRVLIHHFDIKTFTKPKGIPENYKVQITDSGVGMIYSHPVLGEDYSVRVMPGKPHSPNEAQQKPYVVHKKNGNFLDKNGKIVKKGSAESHIPLEEFVYE